MKRLKFILVNTFVVFVPILVGGLIGFTIGHIAGKG